MKGFDTRALILMPEYDAYEQHGDAYKGKLRVGLTNVLDYLDTQDITPYGLYTDEVIHEVDYQSRIQLYNILSMQDTFFVYKNCIGMKGINTALKWERQDIIDKHMKDADKMKDLTDFDMFNVVARHEKKLSQPFIKEFKIVFIVNFAGHLNYKASSNPNDGKIRVYIDAATLVPNVYISGLPIDACEILNVPYGNLPITQWHVKGDVNA